MAALKSMCAPAWAGSAPAALIAGVGGVCASGRRFIGASGDRAAGMELLPIPAAVSEDVAQGFHRVPDVHVTDIQRRETEAQQVGRAKVTDYVARDQCLHHRIRVRMRKG